MKRFIMVFAFLFFLASFGVAPAQQQGKLVIGIPPTADQDVVAQVGIFRTIPATRSD